MIDTAIILSYCIFSAILFTTLILSIKSGMHKKKCRKKEIVLQPIEIIIPDEIKITQEQNNEEQSIIQ